MTQAPDQLLRTKVATATAILANSQDPGWEKFVAIKRQVEARLKTDLAPVIDAIAASERITQEDLAIQINARG